MDVAQSPPLCDRLGEPLGLGERRSLTSSCPRRAQQTTPTLPRSPPLRQTEASARLWPPATSANPQSVLLLLCCCLCIKSADSEPCTSGERTSESQCPHSGMPFLPYPCPPSHKHKAHAAEPLSCPSANLERALHSGLAPLHSFIRSSFMHCF